MSGVERGQPDEAAESVPIAAMKATAYPFYATARKVFRRGETVTGIGVDNDVFAQLKTGVVNVVVSYPDGREHIVDILGSGKLIGEFDVLHRRGSGHEFRAAVDCVVLYFAGRHLRDLCRRDRRFEEGVLQRALDRIGELEEQAIDRTYRSLSARVAKTILRLSSVYGAGSGVESDELVIHQHDLAAILPASREKVNQALRRFREGNLIALEHGVIRILDRAALRSRVSERF